VVLAAALSGAPWAQAQQSPKSPSADPIIIPILKDGSIRPAHGREELSTALQVLLLLTLLTLAPAISAMTNCFTRIIVMPALVVSTAEALLVARTTARSNLGEEVVSQLGSSDMALWITAFFLAVFGLIFRSLLLPMLLLAALFGSLGYAVRRGRAARAGRLGAEETPAKPSEPRKVETLLRIDPMEVRLGYGLIRLVDASQGGDLLDRVTMIRSRMALELGIVIPPVRIRDDLALESVGYAICIKGNVVAGGSAMGDKVLAMDTGRTTGAVAGVETVEHTDRGSLLRMPPAQAQRINQVIVSEVEKLVAAGRPPVLLRAAEIRAQLRRMTEPLMPQLAVISYNRRPHRKRGICQPGFGPDGFDILRKAYESENVCGTRLS